MSNCIVINVVETFKKDKRKKKADFLQKRLETGSVHWTGMSSLQTFIEKNTAQIEWFIE